jgi:hypothetical protein
VRVVQDLIGHAQHFDFAQMSDRVPKLDLPDLAPFFRLALRQNRRQLTEKAGFWSFVTPVAWQEKPGIRHRYDDVHFDRKAPSGKKGTILGVGSRLFNIALEQTCDLPDSYATTSQTSAGRTLFIFRCFDRITGNPAQPRAIVSGVLSDETGSQILKDWQVMMILNELAGLVKPVAEADSTSSSVAPGDREILSEVEALMRANLPSLDLPFRQPDLELLGIVAELEEPGKSHKSQ